MCPFLIEIICQSDDYNWQEIAERHSKLYEWTKLTHSLANRFLNIDLLGIQVNIQTINLKAVNLTSWKLALSGTLWYGTRATRPDSVQLCLYIYIYLLSCSSFKILQNFYHSNHASLPPRVLKRDTTAGMQCFMAI